MKNKILIILLVLIVVAGGIFAAYYLRPQGELTVENILPEGVLVYIHQKDLAQLTTDLSNSAFGKQLSSIDVPGLMRKDSFPENRIKVYERFVQQVVSTVNHPVFQKLLGEDVAVALYPFNVHGYDLKALVGGLTHLVLVIKMDKETEFLELMSRSFKSVGQEFLAEQIKYKNYPVTQATIPQLAAFNFKLTYAKVGSYLVLSFGEENVFAAIDVVKRRKASLAQDRNYQALRGKFTDQAQTTAFLDMEEFIAVLKRIAPVGASVQVGSEAQEMERILRDLTGFKAVAYSASYGPLVRTKLNFSYAKDELMPLIKEFYSCQAIPNTHIRFIPANALAYQWNNCYDLTAYWENFKKEVVNLPEDALGEGPAPQEIIGGVEKLIKLNIEKDILPVLGKEQGWVLADVESSGAFPIPKGMFFISVKDRAKAQEVMTTLLDQPVLFVQEESYKDVKIKFVSTPISVDIQPAYCFLDQYLIISSSRKLLRESIDASQDPKLSLKGDVNFSTLNFNVDAPSNGLLYIHMSALAGKIQKVIDWGRDWLVAKSREVEAYKTGSQKRLSDLEAEMSKAADDMRLLEEQVQKLISERKTVSEQGGDIAAVNSQIESAQTQISSKQKMIELNREKQLELEGIIESLGREKSLSPDDLQFYLEKLVYPALKAFESIHVLGSEFHIGEDHFDSSSVLKMQ